MPVLHKLRYAHFAVLEDAENLNAKIIAGFDSFKNNPLTHKTHHFNGRYENIYIKREDIPELNQLIEHIIILVAEILQLPAKQLQCGFWFNSMQAGDVTTSHTHDDDDELLSGVYYLEAPINSGQLVLGVGNNQETVEPEVGKVVLFKPSLVHKVTKNRSQQHRLSIGMNFGMSKLAD